MNLRADVSRIVIGHDEDGDEISTLVVDAVEDADDAPATTPVKSIPASQRLFMETVAQAIDDAGEMHRPSPNGAAVKAVSDEVIRERYYARIAEKPKPDDTPQKLAERQRKTLNLAIKRNLDAKRLIAANINGERLLWLP